jgi:hypothetical protein
MMKQLNKISDQNPFKVPENYFEELNSRILDATAKAETGTQKTSRVISLRKLLLIAAAVTGFALITYTSVTLFTSGDNKVQNAGLRQDSYQETFINELDILSLEENVAGIVLAEEGADVNKKDIIDYLLLNNIEISEIYEQL